MFLIPKTFWIIRRGGHGHPGHKTHQHRGVFATRDIEPGTVIGDYVGKVIRYAEEDEGKDGLYYLYFNERTTILADRRKPGIHLINHSCAPNCWMYPYKGRTLYVSTRKIFKGEELTVSYLLGTPEDEELPCTHTCKCGTPVCTGSFHNSEAMTDRWAKFEAKFQQWRYTKKAPAPYGTSLPLLEKYPEHVPDADAFNLFGTLERPPLVCRESKLPPLKTLRRRIRESGRRLRFPKMNIEVYGIAEDHVVLMPGKRN